MAKKDWAVMKPGRKSALKRFDDEFQAAAWMDENGDPDAGLYLEYRGEDPAPPEGSAVSSPPADNATSNPQPEAGAGMLENTMAANRNDRMMRYRKNPPCPKCGAHPTVCMMRRPGYELRRCRQCGHRWEIEGLRRETVLKGIMRNTLNYRDAE